MSRRPPSSQTASGIVTRGPENERVIPASRRADGSIRPERKIRPGFIPQEDVKRYTNPRAEAIKLPAGYVVGMGQQQQADQVDADKKGKNARRNEKKRLEKQQQQEQQEQRQQRQSDDADTQENSEPAETQPAQPAVAESQAQTTDFEKRSKAIKKKLRQIEELEQKATNGAELDNDQKEKISKKSELESELADIQERLQAISL
ncbi:uncharacterized protein BJ171DRAFT_517459 [Polychytrium aggregatum]|uniref:uncharacterized protein n=1 Tax=Polychytrium aggregatum TaxID=110093 RepID=UPI0022FE715D|nr:uncharacterized protein BJ171DRAFT_517459 [Polychytrium aggregatum]KAI9199678.1 hypothetical protein BJ171DRAFT_517459 [Polychytrium aggregatum]